MPYNKKIAIVYKTKYGCTMKYAGWLAIKLNADLYEISDVGRWDLLKYKTIIFGSPIYNSKIYAIDYILGKYPTIKNKNLVIFCVNLGFQSNKEVIEYNFKDNEIRERIKLFFLDGSINYDNLSKLDKIKFNRYINKNTSLGEVGLEKSMKIDRSNKHSIDPILNYVMKRTY